MKTITNTNIFLPALIRRLKTDNIITQLIRLKSINCSCVSLKNMEYAFECIGYIIGAQNDNNKYDQMLRGGSL